MPSKYLIKNNALIILRPAILISILLFFGCGIPDPQVIYLTTPQNTIPEGIAVDPMTHEIYLSSIHLDQLIQLDPNGTSPNIVFNREQHGYSKGVGMDIFKDQLYALATYDRDSFSMLFIKNINTQRILSYQVENKSTYFNDLAIDNKGNCYITDTDNHVVYFYNNKDKSITEYLRHEQIEYPNGITISKDQSKLFVDSYSHGIRIIDLATKKILKYIHSPTAQRGIDGIKYHNGKLYFIVNGIKDKSQHGLYSLDLIEDETDFGNLDPVMVFHEKMKIPTTLSIVDNDIYVLANSQMDLLDEENNTILDSSKLTQTYVLKYTIIPRN